MIQFPDEVVLLAGFPPTSAGSDEEAYLLGGLAPTEVLYFFAANARRVEGVTAEVVAGA